MEFEETQFSKSPGATNGKIFSSFFHLWEREREDVTKGNNLHMILSPLLPSKKAIGIHTPCLPASRLCLGVRGGGGVAGPLLQEDVPPPTHCTGKRRRKGRAQLGLHYLYTHGIPNQRPAPSPLPQSPFTLWLFSSTIPPYRCKEPISFPL